MTNEGLTPNDSPNDSSEEDSPGAPSGGLKLGRRYSLAGLVAQGREVLKGTDQRAVALRGSLWTGLVFGYGNVLRLGSSLILTRLLYPEAFGLMTLAFSFLYGMNMLTDVGINSAIVQNKEGEDESFLGTAFSVAVARGVLLTLCLWLAAPTLGAFYGNLEFTGFLKLVAITLFCAGGVSPNIYVAQKRLHFRELALFEMFTQTLMIGIMIAFTWQFKTVYALAWGMLLGRAFRSLFSFLCFQYKRIRFRLEWGQLRSLLGFALWITLSSTFTFLGTQFDRLALPKLIDVTELGFYIIALNLCLPMAQAVNMLASKVMFPIYATCQRGDSDYSQVKAKMTQFRKIGGLVTLAWALGILVIGGPLVSFLYDPRYAKAGVLLPLLSIFALGEGMHGTLTHAFLGIGKPNLMALKNVVDTLLRIGGILGGFFFVQHLGWEGSLGLVLGLGLGTWVSYWFHLLLLMHYGLAEVGQDALIFLSFLALAGLWFFCFGV